ncbi:MAG: glycoside hydrolase [Epsilonproteobacteria bacterium]|nr:glycoside hydrolase [Campylobacterota bacterium]OIO13189.1 MAG: glycoside hydrolase [Helicobacteraceae bacterium CG1_02_36_14]PIP09400.1 MAG: glycoside hydrolase [Sulfurimonas sp. CG23_combo_of_CG06-09_8_20_14_all_36_33]PIS26062.1 MAG: glycoside hydrolase [Sulfurimonas sp. CG08_land_8_20_14_0_20_36_33]PIU35327.1 MAG: glycoside hydrolase [Sulfurimonas sp. CG07_land_8_20_14_0_80_36_56]PIV02865.1 MAG: glycoside hydrolase [Sulfurimonas sp. CG03_land_8_20_14_0_80_36_25]PIV35719.1 MAG: glycoside
MKYFFVLILVVLFSACSINKAQMKEKKVVEIDDLKYIPQSISFYTQNVDINISEDEIAKIQSNYERRYFRVWNMDEPSESLENVKWPFRSFRVGKSYGENLQPLEQSFFDEMYENSNFDNYASLNKKALTLQHVNIRVMPTLKPLTKDPTIAGEGFPFDYLQNSTLEANKPIFVSHYSKDREWVYVFSSFASGWIKSNEIVFLDKKYTDAWQEAKQLFITKENISIFSNEGDFLFKSKIGMMLAIVDKNESDYTVLTVAAYKNSKPMFLKATLSKDVVSENILTFSKENIDHIISEISLSNYGWGGMYNQRDCSSMLRDLFSVFGVWLPRNSSQQSRMGTIISLENLEDEEKIKLIKEKAIPFQTLLYKKGHIVLYVGTYNGEIIIFHNTWGIKTKKDGVAGRVVIGRSIFSSLRLGKNQENYDEESEILRNLKSMNILTSKN